MESLLKPADVRNRGVGARRARFSRVGSARVMLRGFSRGEMVTGLTFGQFSLIDLLQATLEVTGPADVAIATWSAGFYDVEAAEGFRDSGLIRSIRFVMDSSQQKRGQATAFDVGDVFGFENVRTARSHAKFATVTNESWSVAITSSMNLNLNQRVDQFQLVDDADTARLFLDFVDALFRDEFSVEERSMPALRGLTGCSALGIAACSWREVECGGRPKIGVLPGE